MKYKLEITYKNGGVLKSKTISKEEVLETIEEEIFSDDLYDSQKFECKLQVENV